MISHLSAIIDSNGVHKYLSIIFNRNMVTTQAVRFKPARKMAGGVHRSRLTSIKDHMAYCMHRMKSRFLLKYKPA